MDLNNTVRNKSRTVCMEWNWSTWYTYLLLFSALWCCRIYC